MYKVFYKDRTVFFIENTSEIKKQSDYIVHDFLSKEILETAIDNFLNSENTILYVLCSNLTRAFDEYSGLYTIIEAAGGLVRNAHNELLFIFRRGKWDLPKGKIEAKETKELGAIREVEEECGINNLKIFRKLCTTYHTYILNDKNIIKPSYWFEMHHDGNQELTPQIEEEITKAVWLSTNNLDQVLSNTFPSIIDVLKSAGIVN